MAAQSIQSIPVARARRAPGAAESIQSIHEHEHGGTTQQTRAQSKKQHIHDLGLRMGMTDSCSVEMVELVEEFTCSSTTSLVTPHSVPAPSSHLRDRRAVLLAAAATARLPSLLLALVLHPAPCSIPCRGPGGAPMAAKVNPARCTGRAGGKGRREERKVSGAAGARVRPVSGA